MKRVINVKVELSDVVHTVWQFRTREREPSKSHRVVDRELKRPGRTSPAFEAVPREVTIDRQGFLFARLAPRRPFKSL